jgi:hypothetical protein
MTLNTSRITAVIHICCFFSPWSRLGVVYRTWKGRSRPTWRVSEVSESRPAHGPMDRRLPVPKVFVSAASVARQANQGRVLETAGSAHHPNFSLHWHPSTAPPRCPRTTHRFISSLPSSCLRAGVFPHALPLHSLTGT